MDSSINTGKELKPFVTTAQKDPYLKEDEGCLWQTINALCCPFTLCCSLFQVNPQQQAIVSKFGNVVEIIDEPGLYYRLPIGTEIKKVYMGRQSLDINGFEVNDSNGNPIILSTQLIFRVVSATRVSFGFSNFTHYLKDQAKTSMKKISSRYPYDSTDHEKGVKSPCLRASSRKINLDLVRHLTKLTKNSGVEICSFTITSVGYEKTMEKLLLARQEAQAQVDAKNTLAHGISSVVVETIKELEENGNIKMTQEQKVATTTNLLYLLTNHGNTQLNLFPIPPASYISANVSNGQ